MTATADETTPGRVRIRVRPKFSLLGNALASILLSTAPLFAVIYWFASSRGGIEVAVFANVLVLIAGLSLMWRQLRIFSAVTEDELIGNGIFTPVQRVALARIRHVYLVPTYVGAAPDPVTQFLVTGDDGRRLFRMRGSFWHDQDLLALAEALPVPLEVVAEPMTMRDFFRTYPGSAYWFENRRPLQVAIVAVAVLVALAVAVWVMGLLGLPVRFL